MIEEIRKKITETLKKVCEWRYEIDAKDVVFFVFAVMAVFSFAIYQIEHPESVFIIGRYYR